MIPLLLSLTIAFPRAGATLPHVEKCYMIGAVPPGTTNVVVQSRNVPVFHTGAWATLVDVKEGENSIDIAGSNHVFKIERRRIAKGDATARVFTKLDCAGDEPKRKKSTNDLSRVTIVIDAGHGGKDTGALSPHGIEEKDANLRLAKALGEELKSLGFGVKLTRESDEEIPLYDRPKIAHSVDADAFISIHHNAPPIHRDPMGIRYSAVYAWNDIGLALARPLSARMAEALAGEIPDKGVLKANYAVTRNPEIPSCLLEIDFITDPAGELASWNSVRRRKLAKALARGVLDWLAE